MCCINMKHLAILLFITLLSALQSCSDDANSLIPESTEIVYSQPGLVDSIVGTCSTYLVRNFPLNNIDFSPYSKAYLEKNAFTDGDLSEIIVYYLNSDTAVNVVHLQGQSQINSLQRIEFHPPEDSRNYFLRLKLYSSVCTGQLFHLKLRDLKIYGVSN